MYWMALLSKYVNNTIQIRHSAVART
uniref:Uncharacterized protein n=1 Tax=Arundo donax TaxID=35708 RepID=A0A0A8YJR3_ARUDO